MRRIPASLLYFLFCWSLASAQSSQSIPLYLDRPGFHDTAYIGTNASATFCADSALGEYATLKLPPAPPASGIQLFNPRPGSCWADKWGNNYRLNTPYGRAIDIRAVSGLVDTFKLVMGQGILSWPSMNIAYHGSVTLTDLPQSAVSVDMKQTSSFDVTPYENVTLYIIAFQVEPKPAPSLSDIGKILLTILFAGSGIWLLQRRLRGRSTTTI